MTPAPYGVIATGDFFGSGRDGIAIGNPYSANGHQGSVSIWHGGDSLTSQPDTVLLGDTANPAGVYYGEALVSADLNGDHVPDLCVLSGGGGDGYSHTVTIFWGGEDFPKRHTELHDRYAGDGWYFQYALLQAADVTHDSIPDLLMFTRMYRDTVWGGTRSTQQLLVFRGVSRGEEFDTFPTIIWRPPLSPDRTCVGDVGMFGYPVVNIGDVNGDGQSDLAVGAPETGGFAPPGAVLLYLGGSRFDTIPDGYFVGIPFAGISRAVGGFDFNGDSIGDFAVPIPDDAVGGDNPRGQVAFFAGSRNLRPFGVDGVREDVSPREESRIPTAADPLALLVAPNPLSAGSARASYTIGADDAGDGVRVTLTDALGRTRVALAHEAERMGRNTIEIDGATIPAGAYLLAVVTRNHSAHAMLVKMR